MSQTDEKREPITIEDLLNIASDHAGNPNWRGHFPVRVKVRETASVPLVGEAVVVTDSEHGPHILLEVDPIDVNKIVIAEISAEMSKQSQARQRRFEEDSENRRLVIEASGITSQRELVRVMRSIGHHSKLTDKADDNFWAAAEILRNANDPEHGRLIAAFAAYRNSN